MDTYIEVLKRTYLPELQRHKERYPGTKGEFILEEDGDSAHGNQSQKNKVVTFKNKHEIKCYKNCPYSPDLSIIETVWRTLKQRVRKHRCKTKDELAEMIQYEWRKIT